MTKGCCFPPNVNRREHYSRHSLKFFIQFSSFNFQLVSIFAQVCVVQINSQKLFRPRVVTSSSLKMLSQNKLPSRMVPQIYTFGNNSHTQWMRDEFGISLTLTLNRLTSRSVVHRTNDDGHIPTHFTLSLYGDHRTVLQII